MLPDSRLPRRLFLRNSLAAGGLSLLAPLSTGCGATPANAGRLDRVWGRRGVSDGRFQTPRAAAISPDNELFIVDKSGRIQVFSLEGEFQRAWQTPLFDNGKPSGLSFDNAGNLLVADTHYFQVLVYTAAGHLLPERTLGGKNGTGPGEFGFVTHAVVDASNHLYVAEYGEFDRIQKFSPAGEFLFQWGGHGSALGEFVRPQKMALDERGYLWVTDACNHRIQVFDATGSAAKLVAHWGIQGTDPGQLSYPYDLRLDAAGHVFVCEYGNDRVQKFTRAGDSLGCFGSSGRGEGEFDRPWAAALDSRGRLHVVDTGNHRVQRIWL